MNKNLTAWLLYGAGAALLITVCVGIVYLVQDILAVSSTLSKSVDLQGNPAASRSAQTSPTAPTRASARLGYGFHTKGPSRSITAVVEMGPFDLHRRYLSMQGPGVHQAFRISRLVKSKLIVIPESRVFFIENNKQGSLKQNKSSRASLVSLSDRHAGNVSFSPASSNFHQAVAVTEHSPTLYWFRGLKIEVLDERGQVMPTPEFLCHLNLDIEPGAHRFYFPTATTSSGYRIAILSQGTTQIMLPMGLGVPFADRERLRISTQAINRVTDRRRRIKLRLTFRFATDSNSGKPMAALNWGLVDLLVAAKDPACASITSECDTECCMERSPAEDAPNNWLHREHKVIKDKRGAVVSFHWLVPPGVHTYFAPILADRNPNFAGQGPIRAVWLHVHPYCKTVSLVEYLGKQRKILFTARSRTRTVPVLDVEHNDFLVFPKGIALNKKARYRIESVYDNRSVQPQDAMVIAGIFFSDLKFQKPDWAL